VKFQYEHEVHVAVGANFFASISLYLRSDAREGNLNESLNGNSYCIQGAPIKKQSLRKNSLSQLL